MVALAAAAVGLGLARWGLQTVVTLVPDGLPRPESIRIDVAVVAFTTGVAFLSAALAGVVPALTASRLNLVGCLRAGGRGTTGAASARGRRLLVAAQVALAVTVVAAAGLLREACSGCRPSTWAWRRSPRPRRARYAARALRGTARRRNVPRRGGWRVGAAPGIESVTPLNVQPFAGATGWDVPRFTAEGQTVDQVALNPSLNFEAVYPPISRHSAW